MEIFTDTNLVPLDKLSGPEGVDNNFMPQWKDVVLQPVVNTNVRQIYVIPYVGLIKQGTMGQMVRGAKRAIWRANKLHLTSFTPVFGPIAVHQLKVFQKAQGLKQDGQVGPVTLKALAPFFDAEAFFFYEGYAPSLSSTRNKIGAYAWWGYNNNGPIHYAQFRPMTNMNNLKALPAWMDCSTFATKAYKFAGAPDPNGANYNGYGYTGTLAAHGKSITLAQARIGDLVLYGSAPIYEHVTIYVGNGKVIGHGQESGPTLEAWDYRPTGVFRSYLP